LGYIVLSATMIAAAIISGVQEIGRRLGELENRVKALEAKK